MKNFTSITRAFAMVFCLSIASLAAYAHVAINATTFLDANFRASVKTLDGGSDDYFTDAELANITTIDCCDKSISNLKGIEYFTVLTTELLQQFVDHSQHR